MTYEEGTDTILGVFNGAWGNTGPVAWGNLPATPPATATPWARVRVKHTSGGQATLSGAVGTRKFSRIGFVTIQIFVPVGSAMTKAYELAQTIANAYEDARLDVWFRNIRINEVGASGAFVQTDVLADFSYDEVR